MTELAAMQRGEEVKNPRFCFPEEMIEVLKRVAVLVLNREGFEIVFSHIAKGEAIGLTILEVIVKKLRNDLDKERDKKRQVVWASGNTKAILQFAQQEAAKDSELRRIEITLNEIGRWFRFKAIEWAITEEKQEEKT